MIELFPAELKCLEMAKIDGNLKGGTLDITIANAVIMLAIEPDANLKIIFGSTLKELLDCSNYKQVENYLELVAEASMWGGKLYSYEKFTDDLANDFRNLINYLNIYVNSEFGWKEVIYKAIRIIVKNRWDKIFIFEYGGYFTLDNEGRITYNGVSTRIEEIKGYLPSHLRNTELLLKMLDKHREKLTELKKLLPEYNEN